MKIVHGMVSLMLASLIQSAGAQDKHSFEIRGRVVDAGGRPVAGIDVGTSWGFQGEVPVPRWRSSRIARPGTRLRTDAAGRFAGTLYARRPTVALFALDIEKKVGGVGLFAKDRPQRDLTLKVGPLVHLHGQARITDSGLKDHTRYIYVTDTRARIAIASSVAKAADFSFFMPPGEYQVSFSAKDLEKVTMGVLLRRDDRQLDLGRIALTPTNLARHYGKPPPAWNITAARGVKKDVTLADYQGRWVLIEFWAYW